jgi:glutaredoxin-related protein
MKKFKFNDQANETLKVLNPSLFNCFEPKVPKKNNIPENNEIREKDELLDKVETNIKTRYAFTYTMRDLLYQVLWCKPCKKFKRNFLYKRQEFEEYYNKGIDRYHEELDCVEIIQSLRQLKTLVKVVMDDHHQILQNFSKEGLLDISPQSLNFTEIKVKYKNFQNRGLISNKIVQLHAEKEKALETLKLYRENGYFIEDEKIMNQII